MAHSGALTRALRVDLCTLVVTAYVYMATPCGVQSAALRACGIAFRVRAALSGAGVGDVTKRW